MGVPYLVFLSDDADAEFVIGPCNKPLRLDPQNVVYGDGCLLYEYRAMLNIAQSRSWACEVINRRMSRTRNAGDYDSEAEAEALNRAMWKDLGVDWSR